MEIVLGVVAIVLILAVGGLVVWLINSNSELRSKLGEQAGGVGLLQQQLEALKTAQDGTKDTLQKSLQSGQVNMSQSMQESAKVLSALGSQIGELQGTNKQMMEMGNEVRRLQQILSSPKLRGQMGEWSLENILSQTLPKESYELQRSFKDGKIVDALVKMEGYSVSIDAKFPLSGFEAVAKETNEEEKVRLRKHFARDVFKHIDKIAGDYIRPAEGTLDFALMYIPAENVYYETVVSYAGEEKDILSYSLDKKVIPVSPNLLYAYLMTVVMGLHGLQIERQAAEIRRNLKKLNGSFAGFCESWEVLGRHLRNAVGQYEQGGQRLNKFGAALEHIEADEQAEEI